MDAGLFLRGLVIGFSIAAPVGPIGVLCIRRTLAEGRLTGLAVGLGAATADAAYGAVAGLGLTVVSHFLVGQHGALRVVGGIVLLYLGLRTLLARPAAEAARSRAGLLGAYASTVVLTLTNPMTILSFAAVFAGLGLAGPGGEWGAVVLVGGVFLGSAAWWLLLTGTVGLVRRKVEPRALRWVNVGSGLVIVAFGLGALAGARGAP